MSLLHPERPAADDFTALLTLLERYLLPGQAVSEYELLRWLQAPQQGIFRTDALRDPLLLFRSHFILMHCLYRLRSQWAENRTAILEISPLQIRRMPWQQSDRQAAAWHDPLASYYLDLNELNTGRDDVEAMLRHFWQQMLLPDHQQQDLALLELTEPVTAKEIRLQYRRLAMRHHPDRGGNEQHFCQLQAAFQRLKTRYL